MMKKLCRIRLINWHYFVNETINVSGSFLISGENTAGKSTILDAIQLVLTTNHRKFNTAANEKSNRDLKGYVRCKTGNEDDTYVRKGSVITYVALEFFEEKTSKYFTLGVKIDSPDEESKLTTKWFREECKFDDFSFITGGRPSTTEEFRKNDKKVLLISQISEAKDRFKQRLGNLEDRFFDMIPKSLAFKPMDNVKDFINKFILAEKTIEVTSLRNNIAALKELEDLMDITKIKIAQLQEILNKNDEILVKDKEIKTNEILIKKAEIEAKKIECDELKRDNDINEQSLKSAQSNELTFQDRLDNERKRLLTLKTSLGQNEMAELITSIKHRLEILEKEKISAEINFEKLTAIIKNIIEALSLLNNYNIFFLTKDHVIQWNSVNISLEEKTSEILNLKKKFEEILNTYTVNLVRTNDFLNKSNEDRAHIENEINNLKNKKLPYPDNSIKLLAAIEKEFLNSGINSPVRVFCDLIELTDLKWQNAVEGYLNSQRFYILVEPQQYKVALEVYHKIRKEIHTVGIVNTGKLDINAEVDIRSLAYVIKSENRYAKAYAVYLLNRVIRCNDVNELKENKVAITADCMLYQNYAVRRIDGTVYNKPFIGASAYEIQLKNKEIEYQNLCVKIMDANESIIMHQSIIDKLKPCRFDDLLDKIDSPIQLQNINENIKIQIEQLNKAQSDPSWIELQTQIDACERTINEFEDKRKKENQKIGEIKNSISSNLSNLKNLRNSINLLENNFSTFCDENSESALLGLNKFNEQIKTKSPSIIIQNFSPMKNGLENKKKECCDDLIKLQLSFCNKYECDLDTGHEKINEYVKEHHKLISSDIIKYEEDLTRAKENCELEFRESFLARLKENIESAKSEFKSLNSALKNIYYGDDNYKFEISSNKKKESIYQMITSKNNFEGFNLLSSTFDEEYKEEMDDLFAKLTSNDDKGEKVLSEYTDYRSYLDYDIIVEKKDGSVQRFSKVYGDKSGGETQTPYYVAIAASFVQLYKATDTIRIIMLDEAFDKMDDNRISSMMDFFNSQNFQIILATPPSKIEIIGEKVDTILMAIRDGNSSLIEEYDL
jgi:chromosome segregation ATPase